VKGRETRRSPFHTRRARTLPRVVTRVKKKPRAHKGVGSAAEGPYLSSLNLRSTECREGRLPPLVAHGRRPLSPNSAIFSEPPGGQVTFFRCTPPVV